MSIKPNKCWDCFKSKPKKSNKGLVTFDKKSYFPVSFLEHKHDKERVNEKMPKIAQAIEEGDQEEE